METQSFLLLIVVLFALRPLTEAASVPAERRPPAIAGWRLYEEIIGKYNKYILPVETTDHNVNILMQLKLVALTDIDEKNQIMTTTVWVRHEWHDANLRWNPRDYNNINKIQLPAEDLWLPDTVLYNNADGDYQITTRTKVSIYSDGRIIWEPPAIYKSNCDIDIKFFPFDEQVCKLKFGPWSYDTSKVDYWLYYTENKVNYNLTFLAKAADMSEYQPSGEWDILEITGNRSVRKYPCCPEQYVDITYVFHIRRKALYYTVNLIIPVVLISFLTLFVFYLPSQSGEKITLSISILVSMTMFLLLLYDIIPPTSLNLPLISKFLLFTMLLVTLSIVVTILIITIHFRHAYAYDMPDWIRRLFLVFLPRLLFYESPSWRNDWNLDQNATKSIETLDEASESIDLYQIIPSRRRNNEDSYDIDSLSSAVVQMNKSSTRGVRNRYCSIEKRNFSYENVVFEEPADRRSVDDGTIKQAIRDVRFISNKFREATDEDKKRADWEAVARVMDRLFLFFFTAAVVIGTCAILASAPALYDTTPRLA